MPIQLPTLDTLRWQELADEGRGRIAYHAPSWTDHNVSDPGIAVLELAAWIVESNAYALDRIPDPVRRALLTLVGVRPEAPKGARAVASVRPVAPGTLPVEVPPASVVVVPDGVNELRAVTTAPVTPGRAQLAALAAEAADGTVTELGEAWARNEPVLAMGLDPQPGAGLLLGLDLPLDAGVPFQFWLGLNRPGDDAARLAALGADPDAHHGTTFVWDRWNGTDWVELDPVEVEDGTRALSRSGLVCVTPTAAVDQARAQRPGPAAWLRCRCASGRPDRAPVLSELVLHAVTVEFAVPVTPTQVGVGDGTPEQVFTLPGAPVTADCTVAWRTGAAAQVVVLVPDLAGSGPADAHAVLDLARGLLRFGDGYRGLVPPLGAAITATWTTTCGAAAHRLVRGPARWEQPALAADSVVTLATAPGHGADAEPTAVAAGRAERRLWAHERLTLALGSSHVSTDDLSRAQVDELAAPARAATVADIERIVLDTPGTAIARTRAWPDHDARRPGLVAAGIVSVVVVPALPHGIPEPTAGLLDLVRRRLAPTRPVGTRFVVTGPAYRAIDVVADLSLERAADPLAVQVEARAALEAFLDPVSGGTDGRGWRFGRPVYRSEILQLLDAVPGVGHVANLGLASAGEDPSCGNVCLEPTELARTGGISITTGAAT